MRTVPCSVNLMALLSRLMRICVSARRSVSMMAGGWPASPSAISSARPFCWARGRRVSATSAISSWQCTGSIDRVSLPASILATSRISLIKESRWRALARMVLSCLSWSDVRGPGSFISSAPVNPMMAFSGVRSSCDIFAMKADFMRLASASSRFFRAISRLMVSSSAAWCARRMFNSITWRSRACSSPLTCTACSYVEMSKSRICWRSALMKCFWSPRYRAMPISTFWFLRSFWFISMWLMRLSR